MSAADYGSGERRLVDQVNEEWSRKLREELFEEQHIPPRPFHHFLIALGVKEIHSNEIILGNLEETKMENIDIEEVPDALQELSYRYGEGLGQTFSTKSNRENPYRIEIYYEKEDAPEGTLIYAFGRWVVIPFRNEEVQVRRRMQAIWPHDRIETLSPPKQAIIVDRPDKKGYHSVRSDLAKYGYQTTQIRLANEYDILPYASLLISRKGLSKFGYQSTPGDNTILEKWRSFIPGLKESYQMR